MFTRLPILVGQITYNFSTEWQNCSIASAGKRSVLGLAAARAARLARGNVAIGLHRLPTTHDKQQ